MKILFVLKERFYNNSLVKSYGLMNSATHVSNFLNFMGYDSKVVMVIDGNSIDKEVYEFKPDIVIIEALWVTPDKMRELIEIKRYQNIQWVVRVHSDSGFLSSETFALKYINDYINLDKPNLTIAPNCDQFTNYLSEAMGVNLVYLPNVIRVERNKSELDKDSPILNIGCFGSLRILKNILFQAICSIKAADRLNKELHFHITLDANLEDGYQPDSATNPVLRNLEELFKFSRHSLIKHKWQHYDEFQDLVRHMDIGLQLSYTESFNIVAADFVNNDIPIITSDAIDWIPSILRTSTTNYDKATDKIVRIYNSIFLKYIKSRMHENLREYSKNSEKIWINFIENTLPPI